MKKLPHRFIIGIIGLIIWLIIGFLVLGCSPTKMVRTEKGMIHRYQKERVL